MMSTSDERRFALRWTLAYALLIAVVTLRHEPWRDELQAWRLAIDSGNPVQLWHASRFERHPLLFHLILQALGQLSRGWWLPAIAHAAIAATSAWIVLRYTPLPRSIRVMTVFSYFFAFEYAIIMRSYAFGVLFALAATLAWLRDTRRTGWSALFLFLLANTSVVGCVLALAMLAAAYADWGWSGTTSMSRGARMRGAVTALSFAAFISATVLVQVSSPADSLPRSDLAPQLDGWQLARPLGKPFRAFVPLAPVIAGNVRWNDTWPDASSGASTAILGLFSLALVGITAIVTARRRAATILYLVASLGYSAVFMALGREAGKRHIGYLVIAWIIATWLASIGRADRWLLSRVYQQVERFRFAIIGAVLVPMVIATLEMAAGDVVLPFSNARDAARVLARTRQPDEMIIASSVPQAMAVAALANIPIYSPGDQRSMTYTRWTVGGRSITPTSALATAVQKTPAGRCSVIVVGTVGDSLPLSLTSNVASIYASTAESMSRERVAIWRLQLRRPGCAQSVQ